METDRRRFILGSAAALLGHSLGTARAAEALGAGVFASARMDTTGRASLALMSRDGRELASADLPGRGHDMAVSPDGTRIIAFARRPGRWALAIRVADGTVEASLTAGPGRHFTGHGFYLADGDRLVTVEEEDQTGAGMLAVRAITQSYAILEDLPTFGVGPHDAALLPDGRMVVANGGIPVDPTTREDRLDKATMRSDLVVLDGAGRLLDRHALGEDLRLSSLRHLAVAPDGTLAFGCQWQGATGEGPALVGLVRPGGKAQLLETGDVENDRYINYIGSIAFDASGDVLIASSPRGGVAGLYDRTSGKLIGQRRLGDVCGVAQAGSGCFLLTSGNQGLRLADVTRSNLLDFGSEAMARYAWDNHIRTI